MALCGMPAGRAPCCAAFRPCNRSPPCVASSTALALRHLICPIHSLMRCSQIFAKMCLVERQKSAPCRVVIRFTLYLSILIPDTRSTRQGQRVLFIEGHAGSARFSALLRRR